MKRFVIFSLAAVILSPHAAFAGEAEDFAAANQKMMEGMNMATTGDADKDFVAMMIPHHDGAVDMAKVEMKYGKDAEIRKLAEGIIAAQEKEIAQMKKWQAGHK